jgi:broad specificity phosphatase PhoE
MTLTLYLLRHGETPYSISGGFCGELDAELTDRGQQMATAFAAAYGTLDWQAVYASPMKRTIATAKPLCDATGIAMQLHPGLKEIRYGDWEGKTPEDVKPQGDTYFHWSTEPAWNAPPGGETAVDIASRAMPVIADIVAQHPTGNVLVVSHKATVRIILCSLLGIDLGRYRNRLDLPAGGLCAVSFERYGPMLKQIADRSYLPVELRSGP